MAAAVRHQVRRHRPRPHPGLPVVAQPGQPHPASPARRLLEVAPVGHNGDGTRHLRDGPHRIAQPVQAFSSVANQEDQQPILQDRHHVRPVSVDDQAMDQASIRGQ